MHVLGRSCDACTFSLPDLWLSGHQAVREHGKGVKAMLVVVVVVVEKNALTPTLNHGLSLPLRAAADPSYAQHQAVHPSPHANHGNHPFHILTTTTNATLRRTLDLYRPDRPYRHHRLIRRLTLVLKRVLNSTGDLLQYAICSNNHTRLSCGLPM